jgi:hypothetical protein
MGKKKNNDSFSKEDLEIFKQIHEEHLEQVKKLGSLIGFGNIMDCASEVWSKLLIERGHPAGGEFVVGPCKIFTVPCSCIKNNESFCDWCCGCGWITEKVARIKKKHERH